MHAPQPRRVVFHVTGFGAFGAGANRVATNPSALVVQSIQRGAVAAQYPLPAHAGIASACVLPVAARAAAAAVASPPETAGGHYDDLTATSTHAHLRVHLGVNTCASCFYLERCAWNSADFRQPDEDGWQPVEVPVCDDLPLGACQCTGVPVDEVVLKLAARGFKVAVSDDPGRCVMMSDASGVGPQLLLSGFDTRRATHRFVCNYTYYSSLNAGAARRQSGLSSWDALFVHLPPLDVCPLHDQIQFVCCLLGVLAALYERPQSADGPAL